MGIVKKQKNSDQVKKHFSYEIVSNQLKTLPVGSTLYMKRGIFYWQPGPGFIGEYFLLFVTRGKNGEITRKNITITITPRCKK